MPSPRIYLGEPVFSYEVAKACDEEILCLLSKEAIVTIIPSENLFLSNFFLVQKPSGGWRFILNLNELNRFLSSQHFQLEDWRTVIHLMIQNSWMVTLDLENVYLLVPVAQEHRIYLRFQWRSILYEFTVSPFGLSTAPFIFRKILRLIVAYLRSEGYCSIIYFDDFLLIDLSKEECLKNLYASENLLLSLGFLINHSKSQLVSAQNCKYLGFIFHSVQQSIAIPLSHRNNLLKLIILRKER